jgi:hypothetical protein
MYYKGDSVGLLGKKGEMSNKLMGAAKGAFRIANDPLVSAGIGLVAPEVAAGIKLFDAARRSNLLKRV